MTTSGGNMLPILSESDKFDGTNWAAWKDNILIAVKFSGVSGYLDGSITAPTTFAPKETTDTTVQTTALTSQAETPWHSLNPSPAEWKTRDARTKDFLIFNTKSPTGLGIDTSGSAADTWKSYINGYGSTSSMARWNAERELRNLTYSDGDDFPNHTAISRNKLYNVNALGAGITDESFKTIILNSLPHTWDPITILLHRDMPSTGAISRLDMWWLRIRNHSTSPPRSVTALQINSSVRKDRKQLICANPNCDRWGHTIGMCYWLGGEKEGQYPSGFGKRGGTDINTHQARNHRTCCRREKWGKRTSFCPDDNERLDHQGIHCVQCKRSLLHR